jgi:hypothetical protein
MTHALSLPHLIHMAATSSSQLLFSDMPPALAHSWRARLALVPKSFFDQLLDMGFPDWL